jgi:hypothetical protein
MDPSAAPGSAVALCQNRRRVTGVRVQKAPIEQRFPGGIGLRDRSVGATVDVHSSLRSIHVACPRRHPYRLQGKPKYPARLRRPSARRP